MDDHVTFSLSYKALFTEAETLIREITAFSHIPVMQDEMTRGELRGIIRFWSHAASGTGCPGSTVDRDRYQLQKIAGLPEGDDKGCR